MAWAPDYITADDLRAYLRDDDAADADLSLAITGASRVIDEFCNRQFGRVDTPEPRRYEAWPDYADSTWVVDVDDLQDGTGVQVDIDGVTVTDWELEPFNAPAVGQAWTRLRLPGEAVTPSTRRRVNVTAAWGWAQIPGRVQAATRLQAARIVWRRESPFGVAGSPDAGSELRLLARIDPDVAVLLTGLRRPRALG